MGFLDRLFGRPAKGEKAPRDRAEKKRLRRATSSTPEHPTPRDVYLFLVSNFEAEGKWGRYLTFRDQEDERERWVQVAFGETEEEYSVNFPYPHEEDPSGLISKLGIPFPTGYVVSEWERRSFATFDGPRCPPSDLADTIDALFTKLLGAPPNYVVSGRLEG